MSTTTATFQVGTTPSRVVPGNLSPRAPFYTIPIAVASPRSFSGQTEQVRTWNLGDKRTLLQELEESFGGESGVVYVLKKLCAETGISFVDADATRLGNLEFCDQLNGDYSTPSAFAALPLTRAENGWNVGVQVTNADIRSRIASARLRVRALSSSETGPILADRLFAGSSNQTRIVVPELPGTVEAQWYDATGALVDAAQFRYFISVGMTMQVGGTDADLLPSPLRSELATSMSGTSLLRDHPQPWTEGEQQAIELTQHLFPPTDPDFHTFANENEHRAFVKEFILRSSYQGRIIIADPYLDIGVLSEYVLRDRTRLQCDLTLVLSAKRHEAETIRRFCGEFAHRLPSQCRIINFPRRNHGGEFHDRFALVGDGAARQVWHLGSSINSYSRQYPLFAARARGHARIAWAAYVDGLTEGHLSDARTAEREILFEQTAAPPWLLPRGLPITGRFRRFPGWARILNTIAPAQMKRWYDVLMPKRRLALARRRRAPKAIGLLVQQGVIAEDATQDQGWLLGPNANAIIPTIMRSVGKGNALFAPLGEWAARGGFSAATLPFSTRDISAMFPALIDQIREWHGPRSRNREKPEGQSFEHILLHYSGTLDYSSGVEPTGFMPRWFAPFVCEAALAHAPENLFAAIESVPPGLRYRLYNLLLVGGRHSRRDVLLEALHRRDVGLIAVAVLLLNEGLPCWSLTDNTQCALPPLEFAETRAVLSIARGQTADIQTVARFFDGVAFDDEVIDRGRPVINALCPGSDELLDALADLRTDLQANALRSDILSRWERSLPLGTDWVAANVLNADRNRTAFIAKQYLNHDNGRARIESNIANLALGAANAPFLRIRNSNLWYGLWGAVLEASTVACRVALATRTLNDATAHALARVVRSLQPEVVRQMDRDESLYELLRLAHALSSSIVDESISFLTDMGPTLREARRAPVGRFDPQGRELFD